VQGAYDEVAGVHLVGERLTGMISTMRKRTGSSPGGVIVKVAPTANGLGPGQGVTANGPDHDVHIAVLLLKRLA
jgi:hypothetical protein